MRCGLLGRKLGHSYSPEIHRALGSYAYDLYEKEPEEVEAFLRSGDYVGLNVTIPYKKIVIPCCDALSERARRLGAINTLVRRPDGTLFGHNTDYFGFASTVARSGVAVAGKKCLVLGSGGASVTVQAVLRECGGDVVVISRTGDDNYRNLSKHADAAILVNTTPVGMYPNTDAAPVSLENFPALECVFDLIFNPARTRLLLDAQARGIKAIGGLWMLVAQAKESAECFTGARIDDARIEEIYSELRARKENIVLIGMPGCGKSTVAAILHEKTGRPLLDADAAIAAEAGMSIPDIFARSGEAAFRALETKTLDTLCLRSGAVIATGGGCVTRQENYAPLHANGTVFLLERDLAKLPTDGRPLSQRGDLAQMYRARAEMYAHFADHTVDNNGTPEQTAEAILKIMEGQP